jgi:hypothetical protein
MNRLEHVNTFLFITAYLDQIAAAPPIALRGAQCEVATDYTKKKNVLRLILPDKSVYLFHAADPNEMILWQSKIQFHAGIYSFSYVHVQREFRNETVTVWRYLKFFILSNPMAK